MGGMPRETRQQVDVDEGRRQGSERGGGEGAWKLIDKATQTASPPITTSQPLSPIWREALHRIRPVPPVEALQHAAEKSKADSGLDTEMGIGVSGGMSERCSDDMSPQKTSMTVDHLFFLTPKRIGGHFIRINLQTAVLVTSRSFFFPPKTPPPPSSQPSQHGQSSAMPPWPIHHRPPMLGI